MGNRRHWRLYTIQYKVQRIHTYSTYIHTTIHHNRLLRSLIDEGMKENLNLFSLQIGNLYLLPEGNISNSLCRTWLGSLVILRPCLRAVSSYISCMEDGGGDPIILPALLIRLRSCDLSLMDRLPNQVVIAYRTMDSIAAL